MNFLFLLIEISFLLKCYSCQIYTASAEMERLLTTQSILVNTLQEYITAAESKLKKLKTYLENFKKEEEKANEDVEEYLGNPLNDFLLIKRMTLDWKDVENLVMDNTSSELIKKVVTNQSIVFPTADDLYGAADALTRLQLVYDLDVSSFASGKIKDKQTDVTLSAKDCYLIGKQLFKVGDYQSSRMWMQEALRRYNDEPNKTIRQTDILRYLATISYLKKDYKKLPKILNEMSTKLSDEEKIQTNFTQFQEKLLHIKNSSRRGDDGEMAIFYADPFKEYSSLIYEKYRKLCRNEIDVREGIRAKLKCRYTDLGKAFLKLAKLKEEDVFLKPKILVYHDVINDKEIEVIKELSKAKMLRAEVINHLGEGEIVPYRIGKYSLLFDIQHFKLAKISQRTEDMTGLTMKTAEPFQVVNYGLGGQYEPHHDYMELSEKERYDPKRYYSEREATVIFYLNDVEFGGATVFPCLNVSVPAKKGTALIWYDLKLSGAYEKRSLHGGCPVLKGFKWICNKWIGEQGQALLRPCGLTKEAE